MDFSNTNPSTRRLGVYVRTDPGDPTSCPRPPLQTLSGARPTLQLTDLLQNFFHLRRRDGAQSLATEIALLENIQRERGCCHFVRRFRDNKEVILPLQPENFLYRLNPTCAAACLAASALSSASAKAGAYGEGLRIGVKASARAGQ